MPYKVYVGVGHGGSDSGAVGKLVEKNVNLKMALACGKYLSAHGVEVKYSRTDDRTSSIAEKVSAANAWCADLALDVHNNAGGGEGAEVYHSVVGGSGEKLANNILKEFEKIGQKNRGSKTREENGTDYFGFIRLTDMPAVITEAVFVDNEKDAEKADTDRKCKQFGEAIAKGVLATLVIKSDDKTTTGTIYRVQVGSFKTRANAAKLASEFETKGFDVVVVKGAI